MRNNVFYTQIEVSKKEIKSKKEASSLSNFNIETDFTLYIIKDADKFVYIGITSQTIVARFGGSLYAYNNQKKKKQFNGYTGYKWIGDYMNKGNLTLILLPIGKKRMNGVSDKEKLNRKIFAEAVEAELVFLIRSKTNKWPLYQHEIHFHNDEAAKKEAVDIYNVLNKKN